MKCGQSSINLKDIKEGQFVVGRYEDSETGDMKYRAGHVVLPASHIKNRHPANPDIVSVGKNGQAQVTVQLTMDGNVTAKKGEGRPKTFNVDDFVDNIPG